VILDKSKLSVLYSVDPWVDWPIKHYQEYGAPSIKVPQKEHDLRYLQTIMRLMKFKTRSVCLRMTSEKAAKLFNTVSCQFAIHYFFKTKEYLEGFLRNVSFNLKPNGIFIATFMDGQTVHKLINKPEKVEGITNGKTIWVDTINGEGINNLGTAFSLVGNTHERVQLVMADLFKKSYVSISSSKEIRNYKP